MVAISASVLLLGAVVQAPLTNADARTRFPAATQLGKVWFIKHGLTVRPPAHKPEKGRVKMKLFSRYDLQTAQQQRASLRFRDGTTVHMNQRTDVVLRSPHVSTVTHGEVDEILDPGSDHRVQTSAAVVTAIGTNFDVRVKGLVSTIIVVHGAVQVVTQRGKRLVLTNQETTVRPGQAPTPPKPVNAQSAVTWTNDLPPAPVGENLALTANGGKVADFSSERGGNWQAAYINDGRLDRGWASDDGQTDHESVTIELPPNSPQIAGIRIDPAATGGDPASADLKDFQIWVSGSDDIEADYNQVFSGTCLQKDSLQAFTFPYPVYARYIQLIAVSNFGNPRSIDVAEFEAVSIPAETRWKLLAGPPLLTAPTGIGLGTGDRIYVTDTDSNQVDVLSRDGQQLATWTSADGMALANPQAVVDDGRGHIYVADTDNHRVVVFAPDGTTLATWGVGGTANVDVGSPTGLAVDASGTVYIADFDAHRIVRVSAAGQVLPPLPYASDGAQLGEDSIAVDSHGDMYVTENGNLIALDPDGQLRANWGDSSVLSTTQAAGLTVDSHDNVYFTDILSNDVIELAPSGRVLNEWGGDGADFGHFDSPLGVAVDGTGTLYVTDSGNHRVQYLPGL